MVAVVVGLTGSAAGALLTFSLTPNFMSFVASVSTLLYSATRSLSMIMFDGIRIIPGEIAMFSTTFVFFMASLMSDTAFTGSSCVMVSSQGRLA